MNAKLPFEIVHVAVEKVYEDTKSEKDLDKSSQVIEGIVVGSGWTLDEYLERACNFEE